MTKNIISQKQINNARGLRTGQTDAERIMWNRLRNTQLDGVKFRRQQSLGDYIVDFVSLRKKLIVEIDGGQHNELRKIEEDKKRTQWLESKGYRVLRFWNNDVTSNSGAVFLAIWDAIKLDAIHPHHIRFAQCKL